MYYEIHCADCGQFIEEKKPRDTACPRCGRKDAIALYTERTPKAKKECDGY